MHDPNLKEERAVASFIDRVVLHVAGGDGGPGCASVHREKFKPLGGPDGGNGGSGGDIVLVVDGGVHTLLDVHHHPHQRGRPGRGGQGSNRNGANGEGCELRVPEGTVVHDADGEPIADLVGHGTRFVVAQGGRGGLGNAALASQRRRAPGFALLGEPGEQRDVVLELKSVADVGLVGFPSAGKSSLIASMSAARPKIADYPFTTLVPHLGVIAAGEKTFTMADVPGLIPGAATGRGLGLEFLRHIERCAVLVHVLDPVTEEPGRDPLSDLDALEAELSAYGGLEDRPRLAVLTKMDVPSARDMADLVEPELVARGLSVLRVSAVSHDGLSALGYALAEEVARQRANAPAAEPTRVVIRPIAANENVFVVEEDGDGFVVRGEKPERWVRQTDFTNDEAVGYLADRLARLGVEGKLAAAGAVDGSPVTIGDQTFDWEPTVAAGADHVISARGSDVRLDEPNRVRAEDRMFAKKSRRSSRTGVGVSEWDSAEVAANAAGSDEPNDPNEGVDHDPAAASGPLQ